MSGSRRLPSLFGWGARLTVFLSPLLLVTWVFRDFLVDDMLIGMRYAERIAAGDGFTFNDGVRIEGVTSTLYVTFIAFLNWLGLPTIPVARALTFVAVLAAGLLVLSAVEREFRPFRPASWAGLGWPSVVAAASLMASAPFSVWVVGGIDGPALGLVFAAGVWFSVRVSRSNATSGPAFVVGLILAVSCLLRPEGMFLTVLVTALLVFRGAISPLDRSGRRRLLLVTLPPVMAAAGLTLWRSWYFGAILPNTAGVKIDPSSVYVRVGLLYVSRALGVLLPLLLALVACALLGRRAVSERLRDRRWFACFVAGVSWCVYLVWVGGDWMPGFRQMSVLFLLLVLAALDLADSDRVALRRRGLALWSVAAGMALTAFVSVQARDSQHAFSAARFMTDCREGSLVLRDVFGANRPLLGVEPAGCPPYYTGFTTLDMLGLADRHIAENGLDPTATVLTWDEWQQDRNDNRGVSTIHGFMVAHGAGDGSYVWSSAPDLFVLCDPSGAAEGCFRSWKEMRASFDIESGYVLQRVFLGGHRSRPWRFWVRHLDGPLGLSRQPGAASPIDVPYWLLTGEETGLVDGPDGPSLLVSADAVFPAVGLAEGSWSYPSDVVELVDSAGCQRTGSPGQVVSDGSCRAVFRAVGVSELDPFGVLSLHPVAASRSS